MTPNGPSELVMVDGVIHKIDNPVADFWKWIDMLQIEKNAAELLKLGTVLKKT